MVFAELLRLTQREVGFDPLRASALVAGQPPEAGNFHCAADVGINDKIAGAPTRRNAADPDGKCVSKAFHQNAFHLRGAVRIYVDFSCETFIGVQGLRWSSSKAMRRGPLFNQFNPVARHNTPVGVTVPD